MVYILECSEALGNTANKYGTAKYYIGYCSDKRFEKRLQEHKSGKGASITKAASEKGIDIYPIILFPGKDRSFERYLKNQKNTPRIVRKYTGKVS